MKKIIMFGILFFSFLLFDKEVFASNEFVLENDPNGLTYKLERPDRTMRLYFMLVKDKITNELVYCLEPGVQLSDSSYEELEEWDYWKVNLTEEVKNYIERVAYFGYGYLDQWDLNYYYAAQMLIWEAIMPNDNRIYFTNRLGGDEVSLFNYERNQILKHLEDDKVLVSFDGQEFLWNKNEDFILSDQNGVFHNYDLLKTGDDVIKVGDQLFISKDCVDCEEILYEKTYEGNPIQFYNVSVGQKLMRRGSLPSKTGKITLKPYSLRLEVLKVSMEGNPISSVTFRLRAGEDIFKKNGELKYQKNDVITDLITDEKGMIVLENMDDGEYFLEEIFAPFPYETKKDKLSFSLNANHVVQKFVIQDDYQKQSLLLVKEDNESEIPLSNVHFQIWNETEECVFDGVTDETGMILLDSLPVGIYKIVEVETLNEYELLHEPIFVTLDGEDDVFRVVVKNRKIENVPDTLEEQNLGIHLNYRTNVMYDFQYQIEEVIHNFIIYTDNITNRFLYVMDPRKLPSYTNSYLEEDSQLLLLPEEIQNKIKAYIKITEEEENSYTQMLYYINTQILIWKFFYPELKLSGNVDLIFQYQTEMDEKVLIPDWIHDYEFSASLILPNDSNFTITSVCTKVTMEGYDLSDCDGTQEITVVENMEETLVFYVFQDEHFFLSGSSPRTFHFLVTKTKEEVVDIPKLEEAEESKEDINLSLKNQEKPSIKIANVPNTYESLNIFSYLIWVLLCYGLYLNEQH